MALTKSEIIDNLCDEYILSRKDAKDLVDDIFETIRGSLESGSSVKITNFGNFEIEINHRVLVGTQKLENQCP